MIIDISHHHPVASWANVKKASTEGFIISKATEGTSFVDSTLTSFINNCEKNNLSYWLYVFLKKGSEVDQVKFMLKTCKSKVGKHFTGYCLDVESDNNAGNVKEALAYLKKNTTHKTMLYTAYKDYSKYKDIIKGRGSTLWWEARYGLNNGKYSGKYPCHDGVDLHQYTSNGRLSGVSGAIDVNRLTGKTKAAAFLASTTSTKKASKAKKTSTAKKAYTGKMPTLPARGYFKKGDTGENVKRVQSFLTWYGYKIAIDGIYGAKTEKAVEQYQAVKKLKADGLWGKNTQAKAKTEKK